VKRSWLPNEFSINHCLAVSDHAGNAAVIVTIGDAQDRGRQGPEHAVALAG